MGAAGIFSKMAPFFQNSVGADVHYDLMLMWKALQSGWIPQEHMTRDEHALLKTSKPSPLRGLVGFGASFRGRWFSGYSGDNRNTYMRSRISVIEDVSRMRHATLIHADYRDHSPRRGDLIYCDPPYKDTMGFRETPLFDSEEFWATADYWAQKGAIVVVSELDAPKHWQSISMLERSVGVGAMPGRRCRTQVEQLYTWSSPT